LGVAVPVVYLLLGRLDQTQYLALLHLLAAAEQVFIPGLQLD